MCAGNDYLHLMTSDKRHQLRIDLADYEGHSKYAKYDYFQVDSYRDKYRLYSLGTYSGNAGKCDLNTFATFIIIIIIILFAHNIQIISGA